LQVRPTGQVPEQPPNVPPHVTGIVLVLDPMSVIVVLDEVEADAREVVLVLTRVVVVVTGNMPRRPATNESTRSSNA